MSHKRVFFILAAAFFYFGLFACGSYRDVHPSEPRHLNGEATSDHNPSQVKNILDESFRTFWEGPAGKSFTVDLKLIYEINAVKVNFLHDNLPSKEDWTSDSAGIMIYFSRDKTEWKPMNFLTPESLRVPDALECGLPFFRSYPDWFSSGTTETTITCHLGYDFDKVDRSRDNAARYIRVESLGDSFKYSYLEIWGRP